MKNSQNQVNKLKARLWASKLVILLLLIGGMVFMYVQYVRAVFDNSKAPGSTLTAAEWNSLPTDIGLPAKAVVAFNDIGCPIGWSPADGSGGLPDLRGAFIRGMYGDQNGRDVVRVLGSYQADEFAQHTHSFPSLHDSFYGPAVLRGGVNYDPDLNTDPAGGTETRPKNIALIYCVKD